MASRPGTAPLAPPVSEELDHVRGRPDAPVTLVEYGDFQCPYCGQAYLLVREVLGRFENEVAFVFRHMPFTDLHPAAERASEAAEAAGAQGRFWEMHDRLFEHQLALAPEDLRAHAEAVGLDLERFDADMASHAQLERVRRDFESGVRSGVPATPMFFVNDEALTEYPTRSSLERAIQAAMAAVR
jgi:protein-disulfide isomerase